MSVIANRNITHTFGAFLVLCFTFLCSNAQSGQIILFEELLKRPVSLRAELQNKHPRIFFTKESLEQLRTKSKTTDKDLWQEIVKNVRALKLTPPEPDSHMLDRSGVEQQKGDISQYEVAHIIAEAVFVYAIEQDPHYLDAAKRWLLTACKYDPWGYTFRTPNVDLPPAHLLYAVAFAYDVLFDKFTNEERTFVKNKLTKQARLMYDYFKYKPKKKYTFSQNHTFIPMAGLGIAAYALIDEEPEAKDWARLARAVYDRTLLTFDTDGYYYEGFHYFTFSFRWVVRYLDAHTHATGENLYTQMRERFLPLKYYAVHSVLPDGEHVFDFGDVGDGALDRNNEKQTEKLYVENEILYRLAEKYKDSEAQGIAEWMRGNVNLSSREKIWAFYAHDASIKPASVSSVPTAYYFNDSDTVFWRSGWDKNATAFAFRCGPPAGHKTANLLKQISDWKLNTGHSHPDANSFIIWANRRYLTGDTGYSGIKQTSDHNTILIDERGQEKDGSHEMFNGVPYERLDKIRIAEVWATPDYFFARGEAAEAYYSDLNVKKFDRNFLYVAPDYFVVWDEISTNEPRGFSWHLNADSEIKNNTQNVFELINKGASLRVTNLLPVNAKSEIVPQMIMARGRPGSVEKGKEEQRGVQLVTRSVDKAKEFEFLHFLQPVISSSSIPQVSLLNEKARGLQIIWASGDREFVLLKGQSEKIKSDAVRAVLRVSPSGGWTRMILQNGTTLTNDRQTILKSEKPVSLTFNSNTNRLTGWISSVAATSLTINMGARPRIVRVNGQTVKFDYNEKTSAIAINVGIGKSRIESE